MKKALTGYSIEKSFQNLPKETNNVSQNSQESIWLQTRWRKTPRLGAELTKYDSLNVFRKDSLRLNKAKKVF